MLLEFVLDRAWAFSFKQDIILTFTCLLKSIFMTCCHSWGYFGKSAVLYVGLFVAGMLVSSPEL